MGWLHIQYLFTSELKLGEKEKRNGSSMEAVCVCSFFYAISMIHSLEMDRYLTCVIGIKIRPAFLVCSSTSAFVSFSITKVKAT